MEEPDVLSWPAGRGATIEHDRTYDASRPYSWLLHALHCVLAVLDLYGSARQPGLSKLKHCTT